MSDTLAIADAAAVMPPCTCGARAFAFRAGTEPDAPLLGIVLHQGEPSAAWCPLCWPWRARDAA